MDQEQLFLPPEMCIRDRKEGNVGFFTAWRLLAMAYDDGVASNSVLWTPDSSASLYRYLELCKPGATFSNAGISCTGI